MYTNLNTKVRDQPLPDFQDFMNIYIHNKVICLASERMIERHMPSFQAMLVERTISIVSKFYFEYKNKFCFEYKMTTERFKSFMSLFLIKLEKSSSCGSLNSMKIFK